MIADIQPANLTKNKNVLTTASTKYQSPFAHCGAFGNFDLLFLYLV